MSKTIEQMNPNRGQLFQLDFLRNDSDVARYLGPSPRRSDLKEYSVNKAKMATVSLNEPEDDLVEDGTFEMDRLSPSIVKPLTRTQAIQHLKSRSKKS